MPGLLILAAPVVLALLVLLCSGDGQPPRKGQP